MEWFMNILPEIITAVISALFGGFIGFKIGVNKRQKLSQKAGDNARQIQIGNGNVTIGK